MRRQRRHLWGVAVLLLSFFFLVNGALAQVQPETDSGTLTIVGKNGSAAGSCPLKHTDVTAGISGFIARVSVTQEFENTSPDKIEAVYTFPLPQDAAVDSMNIQVGDRVIRGIIKKREEATAMYQAAIQKGQVAAVLHQQRPNIFTQAVGNILPGATVRVTIAFLVRLKYEDGTYEFSFPTVVRPRYIPGTPTGVSGGGFSPDTNKVPDASHITPVITRPGTRAGHDISIALMLDAGVPVHDMRSPTHEIDVERMSASSAVVRLRNLSEIPNKDFIFRYTVAGPQIVEGVLTHADAKAANSVTGQAQTNGFFSIVIQPPERFKNSDVSPKELVFVMDSSGSMGGFPIEKSQRLILNALDGLYPNDTFNIIRFSGDTAVLFKEPVYPTKENMERAREFINGHYGGGGTEMMKAIRAALDPSDAQDHIRIVVFLTDCHRSRARLRVSAGLPVQPRRAAGTARAGGCRSQLDRQCRAAAHAPVPLAGRARAIRKSAVPGREPVRIAQRWNVRRHLRLQRTAGHAAANHGALAEVTCKLHLGPRHRHGFRRNDADVHQRRRTSGRHTGRVVVRPATYVQRDRQLQAAADGRPHATGPGARQRMVGRRGRSCTDRHARNVLWSRYMYDAAFGPGSIATFRADRVPGVPLWVDDATAPGRKRLNYEAFAIPSCAFGPTADACNGSLRRNGIIGPGTWQADLAVSRRIRLTEGLTMVARVEMFNLFNHPNFSQTGGTLATVQGSPGTLPAGYMPNAAGAAVSSTLPYANFGLPSQTAAQAYGVSGGSGGLASVYQGGGPRIVQFVMKVQF